jgi:hypothetical protein
MEIARERRVRRCKRVNAISRLLYRGMTTNLGKTTMSKICRVPGGSLPSFPPLPTKAKLALWSY